jgi:hypothetical protein
MNQENKMTKKYRTKFIHEGEYVALVDVESVETRADGTPLLSLEDIYKMDEVRNKLRKGDLKKAAQMARLFTLTPVAV